MGSPRLGKTQMVAILEEAEGGRVATEVCRRHRIRSNIH